jgi:transposase
MKLLPTYSPELNPIELVWAKAKKVMRETRDTSVSFRSEVIRCLAAVTAADVYNFYVHVLTWWSQRLRNEFGLDATKST